MLVDHIVEVVDIEIDVVVEDVCVSVMLVVVDSVSVVEEV